ncbi:MAG: alpha/beta hydrolase [Actinomycetota bacterium]
MEEVKVLTGAEEFTLGDGPVGALLVHGFTGSPQGLRGLGEYLAARGITVSGPRLPGHGTSWEDLSVRTSAEWVQTVEDSFHKLQAEKDEVFLVGLSFGAALALDLAARYPDHISGIVTISGFIITKDPRRFLSPIVRRVLKTLPPISGDIADPGSKEISYERLPVLQADEVIRFGKRARTALPAVTAPLLIMHSKNDHTVHPSNANLIHDSAGSEIKDIVWFDRSYHVLPLDFDREEVFDRTHKFIKEHSIHGI